MPLSSRLLSFPVLALVALLPTWLAGAPLEVSARSARRAAGKVSSSVVFLTVIRDTYTDGRARLERVTGTGFIFDRAGFVLTNHHVARDARRITCTLHDGSEVAAVLIGSDASTDVAILRLPAKARPKLSALKFGKTSDLKPGDPVIVVGNPKGLRHTVSLGVVSHPARYYRRTIDSARVEYGQLYLWLQTDAVIEPGSSGSPVADLRGRIVGMATRHTGEDLGLAIPADVLEEMARRILADGEGRLADFGLRFQSLSAVALNRAKGVVISAVRAESSAAGAGLRPGDVLLALDGSPTDAPLDEHVPEIRRRLAFTRIGRTVRATIEREGARRDLSLEARPAEPEEGTSFACESWGFTVQELSPKQRRLFSHGSPGLRVSSVEPDSPAAFSGLRRHDIIDRVGQMEVTSVHSVREALRKWTESPTDHLVVRVARGASYRFLVLRELTKRLEQEASHAE